MTNINGFEDRYKISRDFGSLDDDCRVIKEINRLKEVKNENELHKKQETNKNIKNLNLNINSKTIVDKEINDNLMNNLNLKIFESKVEKTQGNLKKLVRFKNVIIGASLKFKRLNISLKDFYSDDFIIDKPYKLQDSLLFFDMVRENDLTNIVKVLYKDKRFLRIYDYVSIIDY